MKDLEKAGKELKKDVDRKAKLDKEAINKDTEDKIKDLRRDFYKTNKDDAKEGAEISTPPTPTDWTNYFQMILNLSLSRLQRAQ